VVKTFFTASALADSKHCRASAWIDSGALFVACGFCVCFVLFIFSCPGLFLSFSFSHSCFPFYLTVSLAEVVVTVDLAVVVMCLQDMQSQNYVSKKKKFL
jgi:hypothetical protein